MPCTSMDFANSSSTMCLANSILLGQVGATCCAATYFIRSMTPTLATLLGKAITPQMVALGASAMSATPPIPIFSGSVVTSIKGAAIHHDGGWTMWMCHDMLFYVRALGSPNIVIKKVYMRTSTSSGNDRHGTRKNMTKRTT